MFAVGQPARPVLPDPLLGVGALLRRLRRERVRLGADGHGRAGWRSLFLGLVLLGVRDVRQRRHAVLRNYPVIGHLRFLLEFIRPEMRQYFIESDNEAAPFSRQQRSLVYQRAKGDSDKRPFGTQLDVVVDRLRVDQPLDAADACSKTHDFRVTIGADARPAVQREPLQHLGDELRRAVGERDPGAQRRRQARQLRPRHRRRLDQPAPPRPRRRPDLGDRLGLLRLLRRRRQLLRGALRRQRPRPAGQDDRGQALAGRQARPRRRAAGAEGDARDRRGARRAAVGRLRLAGVARARSRRRSR